MDILAIVLANLVIAGILVIGFFVGKGNGWKIQLSRLIVIGGITVGLFFLTPIVGEALLKIGYIAAATAIEGTFISDFFIYSIVFILMFLVCYIISDIVIRAIKSNSSKKYRPRRDRGRTLDKGNSRDNYKTDKRFYKDAKKQRAKEYRKEHKSSCVVGGIFGLLTACIMAVIIAVPLKTVLYGTGYKDAYDKTIIGWLDNTFNGSNILEDNWFNNEPTEEKEEPTYFLDVEVGHVFDFNAVVFYVDTYGQVPVLDVDGNPVLDLDGNPVTEEAIISTEEIPFNNSKVILELKDVEGTVVEGFIEGFIFDKAGIYTLKATYIVSEAVEAVEADPINGIEAVEGKEAVTVIKEFNIKINEIALEEPVVPAEPEVPAEPVE